MRSFAIRPEAIQDADGIYSHYALIDPKVAAKFRIRVDSAFKVIERSPESFGRIWMSVRAYKVRGFKHVVYYHITRSRRTTVLAVRHWHELPLVWQQRFRNP